MLRNAVLHITNEQPPSETAIVPVEDEELEVDEEFLRKIREA